MIKLLLREQVEAGRHIVLWNQRDEDGNLVSPGQYAILWQIGSSVSGEHFVISTLYSAAKLLNTPEAAGPLVEIG